MQKNILHSLSKDKIKISFNKKPIPMVQFRSFLTIPLENNPDNLGRSNGWTEWVNKEFNLIVKGGICDGGHWIDSIRFGENLDNSYNNLVNPFYLFDIMTNEGKKFFLEYYSNEIEDALSKIKNSIEVTEEKLTSLKDDLSQTTNLLTELNGI